jgi:hypothetical protein
MTVRQIAWRLDNSDRLVTEGVPYVQRRKRDARKTTIVANANGAELLVLVDDCLFKAAVCPGGYDHRTQKILEAKPSGMN